MSIEQNLSLLLKEIEETARACGRVPEEIKLIVVTKNIPEKKILEAYEYGCRDFGESRVIESVEKRGALPQDIRWHLIGRLQKNKVGKAVGSFALIHSVDSFELAKKISEVSLEKKRASSVLLQVNTSGEISKAGFSPDELKKKFSELNSLQGIDIQGLMTMAPLTEDESVIRNCFKNLRLLKQEFAVETLSMGMSHDYKIAISEGATLLRIGSAIFNPRGL